jgi:membrane protein implicated in regulation of membrane protease activity
MVALYLLCAVVGGTALVIQLVLTVTGFGHEHPLDGAAHAGFDLASAHDAVHGAAATPGESPEMVAHDHAAAWFFGMLSFRTPVAATAFFGVGGMSATQFGRPPWQALAIAAASGAAALFVVHWLMQSLFRLQSDGTTRIQQAVGVVGTVYVRIPGQRAGAGKIQINLQNRTVELQALTDHETLPTGARVVVLSVLGDDTVEVAPA